MSAVRARAARNTSALPQVAAPPRQARSRDLLDRMARAGRTLLARREFEDITIADLAREAGVSVGLFYTRFTTKEHLLAHLARELSAELLQRVELALAPERTVRMGLRQIAHRYFALGAESFVRHRAVLRPLSLVVRREAHRELRSLTRAFNAAAHGLLRDRLLAHRRRIRHVDAEAAVNFAILAASAAMREVILYGEPVSGLSREQRRAARDAAHLCAAYLQSPRA